MFLRFLLRIYIRGLRLHCCFLIFPVFRNIPFVFHSFNLNRSCVRISPRRLISWINFPFCSKTHKRPRHKGVSVDYYKLKQITFYHFNGTTILKHFSWNTVYFFSALIQNAFGNEIKRRNIFCIAKQCDLVVFSF